MNETQKALSKANAAGGSEMDSGNAPKPAPAEAAAEERDWLALGREIGERACKAAALEVEMAEWRAAHERDHHGRWPDCPLCVKIVADDLAGAALNAKLAGELEQAQQALQRATEERDACFASACETRKQAEAAEAQVRELKKELHDCRLVASVAERELFDRLREYRAALKRFRSYYISDHRLGLNPSANQEIRDLDALLARTAEVPSA